jgi:hypothetical protein
MKVFIRFMWAFAVLFAPGPSIAAEFYVAPDGDDACRGTINRPFGTIARAQEVASPGDTVWVRGGEYVFSGTEIQVGILLNKSGERGKRINYWAYPNETPIFDFYQLATQVRIRGISVTGDWLHLKGLEVRGVQQILTRTNESWAIRVEGGSHNIFDRLNLHHNEGPGLYIADGGDNLVVNCDSHHNYDPDREGENADGFGGHSNDDGNVFRGCRAWSNSDDGFDLINAPGVHTIEGCWAWHNGFVVDTAERAGNGAGFKSGGFLLDPARFPTQVPIHVIRFNLSFNNRVHGFYANYHPGPLHFYNNTAFGNPRNFDMRTVVDPVVHVLRNNIAYGPGVALAHATKSDPDDQFNSWNLKSKVTDADFLSVMPGNMDGRRHTDGSLPRLDFMRLAPTSSLVDAGSDVGLPYHGTAPDLGAFETE